MKTRWRIIRLFIKRLLKIKTPSKILIIVLLLFVTELFANYIYPEGFVTNMVIFCFYLLTQFQLNFNYDNF